MKNQFKKTFGFLGLSLCMLFLVNIASAQSQNHQVPNGPQSNNGQTVQVKGQNVTVDHTKTTNIMNPSMSGQTPQLFPSAGSIPPPVKVNSGSSDAGSHSASNPHFVNPASTDANGTVTVTMKGENSSTVKTFGKPSVSFDSQNKPTNPQSYVSEFKVWMMYNKDFMNFLSQGEKDAFKTNGVPGVYNFDLVEAVKSNHKN